MGAPAARRCGQTPSKGAALGSGPRSCPASLQGGDSAPGEGRGGVHADRVEVAPSVAAIRRFVGMTSLVVKPSAFQSLTGGHLCQATVPAGTGQLHLAPEPACRDTAGLAARRCAARRDDLGDRLLEL
uniref:Uncharacterized protein n=1 Tax=Tetraselmis sp. GSL018 TaxID=582737 RepID=A0A061S770_9CHLO